MNCPNGKQQHVPVSLCLCGEFLGFQLLLSLANHALSVHICLEAHIFKIGIIKYMCVCVFHSFFFKANC